MTNQVNKPYAKAVKRAQPGLHAHLVSVFEKQFGEDAKRLVDEAADWMARNVEESQDARSIKEA